MTQNEKEVADILLEHIKNARPYDETLSDQANNERVRAVKTYETFLRACLIRDKCTALDDYEYRTKLPWEIHSQD